MKISHSFFKKQNLYTIQIHEFAYILGSFFFTSFYVLINTLSEAGKQVKPHGERQRQKVYDYITFNWWLIWKLTTAISHFLSNSAITLFPVLTVSGYNPKAHFLENKPYWTDWDKGTCIELGRLVMVVGRTYMETTLCRAMWGAGSVRSRSRAHL